jgi:hypothetical protein
LAFLAADVTGFFYLRSDLDNGRLKGGFILRMIDPDLSPYSYNETMAQEFFPLTKEEALAQGFRWEDDIQMTKGKETIQPEEIPDHINDINDSIISEILRCIDCERNYKITEQELPTIEKTIEGIKNEIKTIKSVNISWDKWQQISIVVDERKPHSVWCGYDLSQTVTPCYFVDKEGYIYGLAPVFSGTMYIKDYGLPVLMDNNSVSADVLGQSFLPKILYTEIFNLINILNQRNIKVVSVFYDGSDFKFGLELGPEIIFNEKSDFDQSFSDLFSAIETGNLNLEGDVSNINYIDLRFDNKIVIRKKEI